MEQAIKNINSAPQNQQNANLNKQPSGSADAHLPPRMAQQADALQNITDFCVGYVDGLLDIDLGDQIDECSNSFIPLAKETLDKSLDEMDRTTDWFMPWNTKVDHISEAITNIVMITPNLIKNWITCPAVGGNSQKMVAWLNKNGDPLELAQKVGYNFIYHAVPIFGHVATGLTEIATGDYYGFGLDMGKSVKLCID